MKLNLAIFLSVLLVGAVGLRQDTVNYPTAGLGPVETLVQFRIKLATGDHGAIWDIASPEIREWLNNQRNDETYSQQLIDGGISREQIRTLPNRDLAILINEKFLRMQDDPSLRLQIKSVSYELDASGRCH